MVKTIREFYDSAGEKDNPEEDPENRIVRITSNMKSIDLTDESVERTVGMSATTLRRKAVNIGLTWAVDIGIEYLDTGRIDVSLLKIHPAQCIVPYVERAAEIGKVSKPGFI